MFRELVPLSSRRHAALRVKPQTDFKFARGVHTAVLMHSEFIQAAASYPIVFVEDSDIDGFRPVALLGLQRGENVFVDADGEWLADYIPVVLRAYPFALARARAGEAPEGERLAVCIDAASELVSLTEGSRLFDASGVPTEVLEQAKSLLRATRDMQQATDLFSRALAERNLLIPLGVKARRANQTLEVGGCYTINHDRLEGLPDAKLCELRQPGWLAAIYSHLVSLQHFERLEDGPAAAPPARALGER